MKRSVPLLATICALLLPLPAQAAPITLDFTNGGVYGGATGETTHNVIDQGIAVGLAAVGGTLHQTSEGLGVNGPTSLDDSGEVGYLELLSISLSPSVYLHEIYIKQLVNDCAFIVCWPEDGYYSINGGTWINFVTNGTNSLTLPINQSGVSSLAFAVGLNPVHDLLDDYSVAGLKIEQVPEPAALLLLGAGLLGAAARQRRLRSRGANV